MDNNYLLLNQFILLPTVPNKILSLLINIFGVNTLLPLKEDPSKLPNIL